MSGSTENRRNYREQPKLPRIDEIDDNRQNYRQKAKLLKTDEITESMQNYRKKTTISRTDGINEIRRNCQDQAEIPATGGTTHCLGKKRVLIDKELSDKSADDCTKKIMGVRIKLPTAQ